MKTLLLAFALALTTCIPELADAGQTRAQRLGAVFGAPRDIVAAVAAHAESDDDVSLALTWGEHESGFANLPRAWSTDARRGQSRCFLQVRADHDLTLDECAATWFATLRASEKLCGSREAGLRALSSGSCTRAVKLVRDRMEEAWYALELTSP